MGSFIPWYGQNKGLGREGQNWLDLKQVLIRNITVVRHHLFLMCLNAPRKPFLEGGFIIVRFVDYKSFLCFCVARDVPDAQLGMGLCVVHQKLRLYIYIYLK